MIELISKLCGTFLLSFILTTLLIRRGIPKLDPEQQNGNTLPESGPGTKIFNFKSTGLWIGFCETLLVFAFVYAGEYGAMAIIIGAKQFVRKENIQKNPSYYLLGTLINVSVALIFALIAKALTKH